MSDTAKKLDALFIALEVLFFIICLASISLITMPAIHIASAIAALLCITAVIVIYILEERGLL